MAGFQVDRMECKITLKNQLKALRFLIFGSLIYCIVIYAFYNNVGYNSSLAIFFSIYYVALLLPTLFLHAEYYLINKNKTLNINPIEKTISFNYRESVNFKEIEKIILILTPVMYRNDGLRFFPFDNYHYSVIKMKDGKRFVFTSLMAFRLEEALKEICGVPIEKKSRFIPSPFLLRSWYYLWN